MVRRRGPVKRRCRVPRRGRGPRGRSKLRPAKISTFAANANAASRAAKERQEAANAADRRSGLVDIATPLWPVSERIQS